MLWESIAFGPIKSRRLGSSLGINLLPVVKKICSFDCIYCECGWTLESNMDTSQFYTLAEVNEAIETKLIQCKTDQIPIDSITFSGNGEPTLHPQFLEIIDHLMVLRDQYYPKAVITCLSNSTQLYREDVREALLKIENPILKLDAATEEMYQIINVPLQNCSLNQIIDWLKLFEGKFILQTLFFAGDSGGVPFDNSKEPHLSKWLDVVQILKPKKVMLYSLDRETPAQNLIKKSKDEMEVIAQKIRAFGIPTSVF
ncbi:MAG: radical SAM protein [Bacteroidales bacterium]|jgi:wyosine [tRNA(Phe)-imidazoG37] synthetase (radical SAM superfamily)|nr:radical SAM protein [Bacteroidales bacterium]